MADRTDTTLGLTQLARTWMRRLGQGDPGPAADALVVLQGPPELVGQRFPLDRSAARILITRGQPDVERTPEQPVRLPSPYVSEPHASLLVSPRGWSIVDEASSNHTYVGTVKVEAQALIYGDEIRLGDVVLLFVSSARPGLPTHAIDPASGLLGREVMMAEASRRAEGSTGLLLLQLTGLRSAALTGGVDVDVDGLVRRTGELLMRRFRDALIGRLETDLFAVVLPGGGDDLRRQGEALLTELAPMLAPRSLGGRAVILQGDSAEHRFPQLLACARAELERTARGPALVEAVPGASALLADGALLDAAIARPDLSLLVICLEDEDRLRHHLGHDRLEAWRWLLRHAVLRTAVESALPLVGVVDERIFVLGLPTGSTEPGDRVVEAFEASSGQEPSPGLRRLPLAPPQTDGSPAALRQALREAAEGHPATLPREPVDALPTPLAAPYSLIWVVASDTARVKTILDAVEVLTRFLAVASLAAVANEPASRAVAAGALRQRRQRRLPLGEWIGLLRELVPALPASREGGVPALLRVALEGDGRRARFLALLERELLPRRNRFVHGDLAADERQRAEQAVEILERLNELVRCVAPLKEIQLLTVLRSDPRRGGGARAEVRVHTGPRESFEVRAVEVRDRRPLFAGSSYLATLDYRSLVELTPLVRLQRCPRCDREELFLADSLAGPKTTGELSAVSTGHRLRQTPPEDDFPEGLRLVLGHG